MFTDLFSSIFKKNFRKKKIDFAFLVHPRHTDDIYRRYAFLKILPKFITEFILLFFWPTYGGSIKGLKNNEGVDIYGATMIVPMNSKQLLHKREAGKRQILSAVRLSKIYGAKIVGLGALTSSITSGGDDLKEEAGETFLTSGNSLTSFISATDVEKLINKYNIDGPVSILGATGSIGRAVSLLLSKKIKNKIIVVGKNLERTIKIKDDILEETDRTDDSVLASTDVKDIIGSEIIIVTTSAHDATVNEDMIKHTKIIYDLTQPKNTPKHIQESDKVTFIDGGLIQLPEGVKIKLDIGLPKGISFSCLSETMILAKSKRYDLVSSSKLNLKNVENVGELAHLHNFKSFLIYGNNTTYNI